MHAWIPVLLAALAPQEPDTGKLVGEAKLTMTQAIERGLHEARTGVLVQAELEFEKGRTVWSLDVAQGTKVCEVLLDAKDGSLVERAVEDEDWAKVVTAAKLTVQEAVAAVQKQHEGTPVHAELHFVDGVPTVTVELFGDGKQVAFHVDVAEARPGNQRGQDEQGERGKQGDAAQRRGRAEEEEEAEEAEQEEGEEHEHDEGKAAGTAAGNAARQPDTSFTDRFGEAKKDLGPTGRNPYFVLVPGYQLVLEGEEHGVAARIVIEVLDETKEIGGIEARVVEERETIGGELKEVTRDYFAISRRTNNVYYLGEDVDVYRGGAVVGHEGSWLHKKNGARYGLMMPGVPLLGARYQQETAPGVAMDRAAIVGVSDRFTCPAGSFENVLVIEESTPLEAGTERKHYARGVGVLQDGGLKLVRYGRKGETR